MNTGYVVYYGKRGHLHLSPAVFYRLEDAERFAEALRKSGWNARFMGEVYIKVSKENK